MLLVTITEYTIQFVMLVHPQFNYINLTRQNTIKHN